MTRTRHLSAILAIAFSGLSVYATTPISFGVARDYSAGSGPVACAIGDFNGDGIPDLAVVDTNTKAVSILIGLGGGAYQAPVHYALSGEPGAIAVGDLNGDSKLDLVVSSPQDETVSVLLGVGDGTLQAPVNYATGYSSIDLVLEDVNGDGKLDAVTASQFVVTVLPGSGDGTLGTPIVSTSTGFEPRGLRVADFNRDGIPDVVVGDDELGVLILLGQGDGTFGAATAYGPADTSSINVGDVNGDGIADLITVTNESSISQLNVFFGKGDGTFQPARRAKEDSIDPTLSVTGDFNHDGKLDVALAKADSASVTLLLGDGTGNFTEGETVPAAYGAGVLIAGDLNGDGNLDLVTATENGNVVSVLLGTGKGTFVHSDQIEVTPQTVYLCGPAIADVNGDGKPDLITSGTHLDQLEVYPGNGDGTFGESIGSAFLSRCQTLVAGDMNGDGVPDMVIATIAGSVKVELGNGDGTFRPGGSALTPTPLTITVADLNGDGFLDVVTSEGSEIGVFLGNGDGTLQAEQIYSTGTETHPYSVALADINQDGYIDVVAAVGNEGGNTSYLAVFLGKGDGTLNPLIKVLPGIRETPLSVVVADFDGDGIPDLGALIISNNNVVRFAYFRGTGAGDFAPPVYTNLPFGLGAILTGDFNGDGKPDVALLNGDSGNLGILLNEGDGTFTLEHAFWGLGLGSAQFTVGDLNGDGLPDVVSANESSLTILLNKSK